MSSTYDRTQTGTPRAAAGVMLIYFWSGVCSLIYEVVWLRLLKHTVGNTVYASSIVVSTFMAGLALGALIARRRVGRVKRPLRLYAALELGVTLSALLLPLALHAADAGYRWLYSAWALSPAALLVVQLMLSAAIMLVPSMLMGSTLPLLASYVTQAERRIGFQVGRLYALNTLGAAVGCFAAGLILFRSVGVMGALLVAAAINLLVAVSAYFLSRYRESGHTLEEPPGAQEPALSGVRSGLFMAAIFVSGLVGIGYELVWMRSVVLKLGGWTYVFSSVLTVYLVGNVIGAAIGSVLTKRLKQPVLGFGISMICLGLFGLCFVPSMAWWLNLDPATLFGKALASSVVNSIMWPIFNATALFLLPSIAMGIGFPMALQTWGIRGHRVGDTAGLVYGINTIGAVLGGVLTGFVLIPLLGTQRAMIVLSLLAATMGAVMLQTFLGRSRIVLRILSLLVIVGLILLAVLVPSDLFVRSVVAGPRYDTLEVREGTTTTASVIRHKGTRLRVLASDGVMIAGEDEHRIAQQTLGHLGLLLHADPRRVLSIGFGTGETTACMAAYELDRLDCVEIAQELVILALANFQSINLGAELDRYVNMIYMDGKNYLHLADTTYDVIVNGANIPADAASAPMFTRDHFLAAKDRLAPGGLFVTKLHIADISRSHFDSILGTFTEAFPHVTVWFPVTSPSYFFYLVGSREPQAYSPDAIDSKLARDGVRRRMDVIRFSNSFDVLSCYFGDRQDIQRYLKDYRVNTDNSPFIEFSLDRDRLDRAPFVADFLETVRTNSVARHIDWAATEQTGRDHWLTAFQDYYQAVTFVMENHSGRGNWERLKNCHSGLSLVPGHPALINQEHSSLLSMANAIFSDSTGDLRREALAGSELHQDMGAVWLLRAWALRGMGRKQEVLESLREAMKRSPSTAVTHGTMGLMLLDAGNPKAACEALEEAVRLFPSEATFRFSLGTARWHIGDRSAAIAEFRQGLVYRPSSLPERIRLAEMLARVGNKSEAAAEYRTALEMDPENQRIRTALERLAP
jgi:spermidine synthase